MDIKAKIKILSGDILGGLNAAIVTLPQALAFGVTTGLGASAGIWGAIIACLFAGIVGPKTPIISGATGPVVIVLASVMASIGHDINAIVAVIMIAAIMQILASLTNLVNIVKYIPYPVISGFMNGVGVVIILMQLNPLIGFNTEASTISSIKTFITNIQNYNQDALILGIITLIIVFFMPKKINKIIPAQILALIIGTIISIKSGMNVERISEVTFNLPSIVFDGFELNDIIEYLHYGLILAIVFSSESMLTGLVTDSLTKTRHSPKLLLASQGFGNVFCALTGSLPGSAATMRTVAAIKAGATTKFSAIVTPAVLFLLMFKFSDHVAEIPLAVLAGILIKIGYDIVDTKLLKVIKIASKDDLYVLFTVFILTVFYNLIFAVAAGITLAALLYAKRIADKTKIIEKTVYDKDIAKLERIVERDYSHKIRIAHIDGQFFFGSATQMIAKFDEMWGTRYLILNYDGEDLLDISAIFALEDIIERLKSQDIKIVLVIKNEEIFNQLESHKIVEKIKRHKIFYSEIDAIDFAKKAFTKKAKKKYNK
ncbi:MAG: SulP family inorganic anion transporter [Candidatus Gastranaerophilales bacterium]